MKIVINSSPLIFLSKIEKMHLLTELFDEIFIPSTVFYETVTRGKEKMMEDAFVIENFINENEKNKVTIADVDFRGFEEIPLGIGEKAVIAFARRENIENVLIDEENVLIDEGKARTIAKMFRLKPRGTLWVLALANSKDLITYHELKESVLRIVEKGYRIKEEIFARFLIEIETRQAGSAVRRS
jgi:predicted nucleic acid-binding protein